MLLREIQRTGDIFFPKRWMDVDPERPPVAAAAATVRAFVDRAAAGLSGTAAAGDPLVGGRSLSGQPKQMTATAFTKITKATKITKLFLVFVIS